MKIVYLQNNALQCHKNISFYQCRSHIRLIHCLLHRLLVTWRSWDVLVIDKKMLNPISRRNVFIACFSFPPSQYTLLNVLNLPPHSDTFHQLLTCLFNTQNSQPSLFHSYSQLYQSLPFPTLNLHWTTTQLIYLWIYERLAKFSASVSVLACTDITWVCAAMELMIAVHSKLLMPVSLCQKLRHL